MIQNEVIRIGVPTESPGYLKLICISDTHDKIQNLLIPNGDVLLHSGDFSCRGTAEDSIIIFLVFLIGIKLLSQAITTFDLQNEICIKNKFLEIKETNFFDVKKMLKDCIYLED